MKQRKAETVAAATTVALHLLLLAFLVLMTVDRPQPQREGGVEVMLGNFELAAGELPAPSAAADLPLVTADDADDEGQPLITQEDEQSVALDDADEKEKEKETTPPQKTKEQLRAEHEQKVADEANRLMNAAFGKGNTQSANAGGQGTTGAKGSPDGSPTGIAPEGSGGHGSFSLSGRSLGTGVLPAPSYDVEEEGIVVVDIWVAPSGKVVRTSINHATNTYSSALRTAAEKAASLAVFNAVDGVDVQRGTITYVFNLR